MREGESEGVREGESEGVREGENEGESEGVREGENEGGREGDIAHSSNKVCVSDDCSDEETVIRGRLPLSHLRSHDHNHHHIEDHMSVM